MSEPTLWEVQATYTVTKKLLVEVPEGESALDPANWLMIVDEWDLDYHLYDVLDAEEKRE